MTEEADISGYDKDTEGTQEITVTYTEGEQTVTATFNVTVKASGSEVPEVTLTSITVTAPAKLEYTVGEELDLTGMTVTAVYSDETTKGRHQRI